MIGDRIELIRKKEKMTRSEFGMEIGKTEDAVYNIERDRAKVNKELINLICSKFYINEEWLSEGTGEMYTHTFTNPSRFADLTIALEENQKLYELTEVLLDLDDEQLDIIKKLIQTFKGK